MRRVFGLASAVALALALAFPPVAGAFSANGACQGFRISSGTIEVGPGFWSEGPHSSWIRFGQSDEDVWGPFEFVVSRDAPLYPGQVWVAAGLLTTGLTEVPDQAIDPAQDTVFWAAWMWDMAGAWEGDAPETMQQAKAEWADPASSIEFRWDAGDWVLARKGPLVSACSNGFLQLLGEPVHSKALFVRTFGAKG